MSDSTQNTSDLYQFQENEVDLRGIFYLLKANYKIILFFSLSFLMCGMYYASIQPPVYRSTALVQVKSSGSMESVISQKSLMQPQLGQSSSADVEVFLLKTPYILGDVVRAFNFDITAYPRPAGLFSSQNNKNDTVKVSELSVSNNLLAKKMFLVVLPDNTFNLLTKNGDIILKGRVGQLTQSFYQTGPVKIRVDGLHGAVGSQFVVIKQPVVDVANGLAQSLSVVQDVDANGNDTGILRLSYVSHSPDQAQKILNTVLYAAILRDKQQKILEANHIMKFLKTQLPLLNMKLDHTENQINEYGVKTGIFSVKETMQLLSINLLNLQKSLKKLQEKKIELLENFTSNHPYVIAVNQEESQVRSEIGHVKSALNSLPVVAEKQIDMQRNFKMQEKVYSGMLSNMQSVQMEKEGLAGNIRVLDSASYPTAALRTKAHLIMFASFILGAISAIAFIFLRHILSPVIDDPDAVEHALGISVASILPFSQKQADYVKTTKWNKGNLNTPFVLAREYPKDVVVESLRSLRTAVQMLLLEAGDNIIATTGCSPSSGKSFISSNLAAVFSDLNKRVLIIDADIRKGKLFQTFAKSKTPGLSEFLEEKASLSEVIQPVSSGKLDLITTGYFPENPSELLSTEKFNQLLLTLKPHYDLIVIDTPPVLAVTDAALMLKYSKVNLLVLGIGKDSIKETLHVKHFLEKNGIKLTGVILNSVQDMKHATANGYGKYNYYYAYGDQ